MLPLHADYDLEVDMQSQPAINGIDHVSLLALHAERTTQFYVDLLGLQTIDHVLGDERSAPDRVWLGDDRSRLITIIQSTDGRPGELGIGTTHHVALTVASFDTLLKWKRWLQRNQILVYGPYDQQAYQDIIFTDPDGVLLEIATQGPGWEATQDGQDVYSPPKDRMAPYRNEEEISMQTWPRPVTKIEPDMQLQGLHHISTIASSLEQMDRFYRDVLGLPLVRKTLDADDPEVEHWYWGLEGGRPGTVITAFPIVHAHQERKPIDGRAGVGVVDHFALDVGLDEVALSRWSTDLLDRGLEAAALFADQARSVSLRSPDGHVVELVAALHELAGDDAASDSGHDVSSSGALRSGVAAGENNVRDNVSSGESVSQRTQGTETEVHV
jgi:glyoxalase family protein